MVIMEEKNMGGLGFWLLHFFISDKQIKKELPERTEKDWQAYGR